MTNNDADVFVQAIAQEIFDGVLPPFVEIIVESVIRGAPCIRKAGEADTQAVADELKDACYRLLWAQHAAEETEFLN